MVSKELACIPARLPIFISHGLSIDGNPHVYVIRVDQKHNANQDVHWGFIEESSIGKATTNSFWSTINRVWGNKQGLAQLRRAETAARIGRRRIVQWDPANGVVTIICHRWLGCRVDWLRHPIIHPPLHREVTYFLIISSVSKPIEFIKVLLIYNVRCSCRDYSYTEQRANMGGFLQPRHQWILQYSCALATVQVQLIETVLLIGGSIYIYTYRFFHVMH